MSCNPCLGVGIKPALLFGHIVDGAANAGASVDVLQYMTQEERPQKVVTDKCDSHKINTSAKQGSGTSPHKTNLNPECGASLKKLHTSLVCTKSSGIRMNLFFSVQKENGRLKTKRLDFGIKTRWGCDHGECVCATSNHHDFDISLKQTVCENGIDHDLFLEHEDDLEVILPTEDDWDMWAQYAGGMFCVKQYSTSSQSAQVVFHMELFWGRSCLEQLGAPFFKMAENLSKAVGARGSDLTQPRLNQLVLREGFFSLRTRRTPTSTRRCTQ